MTTIRDPRPGLPVLPADTVRVELGRRSAWLYGPGVYDAVCATGVPAMKCPTLRVWTVPIGYVDDVLSNLEHGPRGRRRLQIVEVDR